MAIEAIYPYIAVAYGTFGIVFGVMLWWKTQRRIDRTKTAIEIQVANAVTDISKKVDDKLGGFEMPEFDLEPITDRMDAIGEEIAGFKTDMPDLIATHIDMHMKAMQATDAKQIKALIEELNIEGITEEAKEAAVERLSTKQKLAYGLMKFKVPKKTKDEHPLSAAAFEQSRGLIAQALIEADIAGVGNVTVEGGHSGGDWNPGFKRR